MGVLSGLFAARNPFHVGHDPNRPEPGGIDGRAYDWVRWYPPDTPFHWGVGFDHPFTNVPLIPGGRWLNQFLPDKEFEVPPGVSYGALTYPVAGGTSGAFQAQLQGGAPHPVTGPLTSAIMNAAAAAQQQMPPAPLNAVAGGFGRS